ncbi:hypothetical protein BX666DRAFT_1914660 [Dichotomocladium elegans]|nr:hypothetical protein BX666DRAFT_1914660 [Dichotomocladium elegans]
MVSRFAFVQPHMYPEDAVDCIREMTRPLWVMPAYIRTARSEETPGRWMSFLVPIPYVCRDA